jgi:hypothetical protein
MKQILVNVTALAVLGAALFLAGCSKSWHRIEGNNNVVTETRSVPSFARVNNSGIFEVYIVQTDYYEVVMEAESNLLPFIRTRVSGNTLEVDTKDNLKPNYPIKVFVYTPVIEDIRLSGSGRVYSDSLEADKLDVDLSGSGSMDLVVWANEVNCTISGSGSIRMYLETNLLEAKVSGSGDMDFSGLADRADFKISGSGSIHAYDLPVDNCYTTTSGSGDMYVHVNDYLDVNISGSGDVYYLGNPVINTKISGSGSVIHP